MSMLTEEVSKQKMLETIHYMTENFPYRLAGSPCEAAASRYVTERLRQYGLEVENKEFYTYNSDPMYSKVTVLDPAMEIDSLPCAHIRATKPEGEVFELIYVGNGDYASYKDINVKGKMVLVEVSYAPPVPEKARIAYEMGAAGIMCMNWGNDEEVICRRGLKGVWGNPTEANFHCIPDIVGVGVTRGAGLKLKQLCLEGKKVEVKVTAIADRTWSIVHQPTAILRGNGTSDEFLLVCSHLDAWKPGVTCNATGNATTLEICRILSKHRQELDRDVYFVFWDGHEVAEAAGSTWFVDNNWDKLNKHCVCYMHIDSIRFPRLLQGAESALVGGVALGLHLHLGLNIAAGVLLFRFFECFQKFTGTLDGLLHGNDRGTLGVLDLLANTAVFHAPGNALALLQIGEVLRFADTKLFKGHRGVLDVLLHALMIEDRRLFQKPLLGILRRFLLKSRGNGVSCGCI